MVSKCQGRVIDTQPLFTASKRVGADLAVVGNQSAVGVPAHQVVEAGQPERGLHFAGVVVGVREDHGSTSRSAEIPVAQKDVCRRLAVQLAQQRLQIVAAVAVQQHDLANAMMRQRVHQVGDHREQRRGVQVHGQRKGHLIGFGAVGNRRQQHDLRPAVVGRLANLLADRLALEHVGAVGQVQIVRLGRPARQHGHFVAMFLDVARN